MILAHLHVALVCVQFRQDIRHPRCQSGLAEPSAPGPPNNGKRPDFDFIAVRTATRRQNAPGAPAGPPEAPALQRMRRMEELARKHSRPERLVSVSPALIFRRWPVPHQLKADVRIWIRSAVAAVAPNGFAIGWLALPRRSVSWPP